MTEPKSRARESYSLTCHCCFTENEQPAAPIDAKGGKAICIRCGAKLSIQFRDEVAAA
jgi:rRNA maturation endonuclease Nob1